MEPYRSLYPEQLDRVPTTDLVCQRVLCLPTGTSISIQDIERISAVIETAIVAKAGELQRGLKT